MTEISPLEIMRAVDQFYSTSWQHLIYLAGFVTIAVPLVSLLIQNRIFRHEEERLKKQLSAEIQTQLAASIDAQMKILNERLDEKLTAVDKKVSDKLKEETQRIDMQIARVRAAAFHIQANQNFKLGEFRMGTDSILDCLTNHVKTKDKYNLRNAVEILLKVGIPRLKKSDLSGSEKFIERIGTCIEDLNKIQIDNDLRDLINQLDVALAKLRTLKEKPEEKEQDEE